MSNIEKMNDVEYPTIEEWGAHKDMCANAINKLDSVENKMVDIAKSMQHLSKLDSIVEVLNRLNNSLVGPATGRKQVSLLAHMMMMLVLGAALLTVIVEKSNKTISISPTGGIVISERESVK